MAIFSYLATTAFWASATTALGTTAASAIIAAGQAVTWSLASMALNRPQASRQEMLATLNQTESARRRAYGRNLMGGIRALFEARDGRLYQVVVIHHGRVDGLLRFWIDGEPVGWNADTGEVQRYKYLFFRDGSGQGGDYEPPRQAFPEIWTADHRLQGQATFCSVWGDPSDEDFQKVFPKGDQTQVQAEIRGVRVRNLAGDLVYTENAGLCIRDQMTHPTGWGIPLARLDAASWASFAALCGEAVPLLSGGTEPRYRLCGFYTLEDPLKDVTTRMLATCDGQIYETADGTVGILGGAWSEPDVTITDRDILSIQMSDGFDPFTDYNVLQGSFVSPAHGYQPTQVAELVDEEALATQPRRTDMLDVDMCPSGTQLQRLMQIKRAKDRREYVGTLRTNLVGLKARFPKGDGIHTIRVVSNEFGLDGVFEVTSHSFDIERATCEIGIGSILNPYPWHAPSDERPMPPTLAQIGTVDEVDPVPTGAVLVQERVTISGDVQGVKLSLSVDDPEREGLQLRAQIAQGDFAPVGPWTGTQPQWDEMTAAQLRAQSDVLGDGQQYTVRYRWRGYGDWLKFGPVTVLANPVTPPTPSSLGVVATGDTAYIDWINAPSGYFRTQVLMGATTNFAEATIIATVAGSAGRPDNYTHDMTGITGTRRFWVRTLNRSGVPSEPIGPISATF
ncbi:hypothetical protein TW83_07630 [Paracoccus sp. S4493]|uniref:hypothetical protein n=1 Tax=Paracoccus sp. S4493 TaxID=579490 RepID=UPI0005FA07CA|nr:hypothetical protein [Paracoccus sp. S4493]KJZ31628.1 hypothetical protein TW83_07630 [Paracoccus sp. S4493]